jgi:hypothetical protein
MREPPAVSFAVPTDGWMRGYSVELIDSVGRRLPQDRLHHLNLMLKGKRDLFNHGMLRVAAAGPETAPVLLPRLLGVPAAAGDTLLMTYMLHNPTNALTSGLRLRVIVPFTTASEIVGAIAVYPFSVAVGPQGEPNLFDLPPGRSEHFWEGSPSVAVRLLGLSGHMHLFGASLRLEDRTSGKMLWRVATRAGNRQVVSVPRTHFLWPLGAVLLPGHVYRVTAVYENPTGQVIPRGGMGVIGGIMLLARGAAWPVANLKHPEYVSDLNDVLSPDKEGPSHGYEAHSEAAFRYTSAWRMRSDQSSAVSSLKP